jgi:hypothetical protein
VHEAKRLRRKTKAGQRSLRAIAAELATLGYVNERGAVFSPSAVASMLAGRVAPPASAGFLNGPCTTHRDPAYKTAVTEKSDSQLGLMGPGFECRFFREGPALPVVVPAARRQSRCKEPRQPH